MQRFYLTCFVILLPLSSVEAQEKPSFLIHASRATSDIIMDGVLDDPAWQDAEVSSPFINKWPKDTGYAEAQTEVKLLFNDQYLFVSAVNHQRKEDLIIQTLKRDQIEAFWGSDGFSIVLDPLHQKTTAFLFGVNAAGAQVEAAITSPGSRLNENWDNKWYSYTKVYDTYWTVEMAIPFSALRFKRDLSDWRVNFVRSDMKRNAFSTWSAVPLQFNGFDLGYMGTLQWKEPLTPKKSKVTLIPYLSSGHSKNHEDHEDAKTKASAGLDAKVAVTSSMNLDLTYRPDFSNVDVDRQMTNVTRFSLLYPERRNFFLENADLFSNMGSWMSMPFFSRKIGLRDGQAVPIVAGARLSGNVTGGLRVGVMDIQTEGIDSVSANNYLVSVVEQRVLSRSRIKVFAANRQTTRVMEGDDQEDYNRAFGAEAQYTSNNGSLNAFLRAHTSSTPARLKENEYLSAQVGYVNNRFYSGVLAESIGTNYVNDVSFVPKLYNYDALRDTTVRIGYRALNPWFGLMLYPKKGKINMVEPNTWSVIQYRTNGRFLEWFTSLNTTIYFKDKRQIFVEAAYDKVDLPFASDLLDNDRTIPAGRYTFTQYNLKYKTDNRKKINAEATVTHGGFYNGDRTEFGVTLNVRAQPWGNFGVSYLENDIRLPEAYGHARFVLVGPRAEISLANNIWWSTFIQYNTQADNVNINSRFQWRYKPMSDIFIVYTDNSTSTGFKTKNRGIVVKMTYWLNW